MKAIPRSLPDIRPRRLPRGVNRLPKKAVLEAQRNRLIEATAYAVAERGYADTAVSNILAMAGVSRAAFYEIFKDKEECFLFGFNQLSRAHVRSVETAMAAAGPLPARAVAGITVYMQAVDFDARFARAFIVEAEAASPQIRLAFNRVGERLEGQMKDWFRAVRTSHPSVPVCADVTFRMLRAGLTGYLTSRIRDGAPRLTGEVDIVSTFVFSTLGLYRWAQQMARGEVPKGVPRE